MTNVCISKNRYYILTIGGIGNQLFQYAFALRLSNTSDQSYVLVNENKKHRLILHKYFELPGFNYYSNSFFSLFVSRDKRKNPDVWIINEKTYSEQAEKVVAGKVIHGYYQSTDFFNGIESKLKGGLKVKERFQAKFEKKFLSKQKRDFLAIHIRGGDYKENPRHLIPTSYYQECLNKIKDINRYNIYVLTDDKAYATNIIKDLDVAQNTVKYSNGSLIDDFLILKNADTAIISNSTFAWWAAFLNERKTQIFAPKYWLGYNAMKEYPRGIMNVEFTWI